MTDQTLLDKVKEIMYGDADLLKNMVTKTMFGYTSQQTSTGKSPDEIDLTPAIPDQLGLQQEHVTFTFGRFSVPTKGHGKLLERLREEAGEGPHYVFVTHTQDTTRNPLSFWDKTAFMEMFWPEINIYGNEFKPIRTIFDAIAFLENAKYKSATLVVGQDRFAEFTKLLEQYPSEMTIGVVAVPRTDDEESATKARAAVLSEDFETFAELIPTEDSVIAQALYRIISEKLERPNKTLKEQVQSIMNRVPTPGGERDGEGPLGMDSNLASIGPEHELKRRKTMKRFKQIQDET